MLFVGNPFTIDKVGVEATCCGTIVVTDVTTLGEHTGTFEAFLNYMDYRQNPSIETQIRLVMENQEFFKIASTKLALQGRSMNNLESLVNRIALELLAVKA
jgi:hypothetical protein